MELLWKALDKNQLDFKWICHLVRSQFCNKSFDSKTLEKFKEIYSITDLRSIELKLVHLNNFSYDSKEILILAQHALQSNKSDEVCQYLLNIIAKHRHFI